MAIIEPLEHQIKLAMMSSTWDMTIFVVVTFAVLSVSVLSAFEGIRVDFTKRGKDFRSGSHQRNVFYFALLMASLYKFVCMTIEGLIFGENNCAGSHLCTFVRLSPDVGFIAAYAVMLTFWTQVKYFVTHNYVCLDIYL